MRWGIVLWIYLSIAFLFTSDFPDNSAPFIALKPSESVTDHLNKAKWQQLIHRAAPGTDWKAIEYQNGQKKRTQWSNRIQLRNHFDEVDIGNGTLTGKWIERGSNNQAGSVLDTEFDSLNQKIYLIADGGSLWKGNLDGSNWEVVNQDYRFSPGLLKFFSFNQTRRLVAIIDRIPHYSDNHGKDWVKATGIQYTDSFGDLEDAIVIQDAKGLHIYCLSKASYSGKIQLFHSKDYGVSYQSIQTFKTSRFNKIALAAAAESKVLFGMLSETEEHPVSLFKIMPTHPFELQELPIDSSFKFFSAPANLSLTKNKGQHEFYAYSKENQIVKLFVSSDQGTSWTHRGTLPTNPWKVGLYISPSSPDHLYYGEVDCFRSTNGGQSWQIVNPWWEYYSNITNKLHADIMHFQEFSHGSGTPFLLISNHGGLSISTDYLESNTNIGLKGLNVSQYYSVRTSPVDHTLVYAGSQDQGLQFTDSLQLSFPSPPNNFRQVTPGDFGHLTFTNQGKSVWASYPGGSIFFYADARSGKITASFTLDSENESVWLTPIIAFPEAAQNVVYMAGGNITGSEGSYIIELSIEDNKIVANQQAFDFLDASAGGTLSALAISPLNSLLWYAATTNGRFFTSTDAGLTWEQTIEFIPNGQYLYGQAILPSSVDENIVFLAGSGYSNPSIYKSDNQGFTFFDISNGLPPTLITDLAATENESFLFAAAEAGPFIYDASENHWYSMYTPKVPNQTFWSVEYLASEELARFGTYGRGIWDFNIDLLKTTTDDRSKWADSGIEAYPNPATDVLYLDFKQPSNDGYLIEIFNTNGQIITKKTIFGIKGEISLAMLPAGMYVLKVHNHLNSYSTQLVVNN